MDRTAQLGASYVYQARTVATGPGKGTRESLPSSDVRIEYKDSFPPGPPGLVTADAIELPPGGGGGDPASPAIRVSWSPPLGPDVAGYRVYRSTGEGAFSLAGQVGAAETTWIDRNVKPGSTYRYSVTAIDTATPPNESERSEIVDVADEAWPGK